MFIGVKKRCCTISCNQGINREKKDPTLTFYSFSHCTNVSLFKFINQFLFPKLNK